MPQNILGRLLAKIYPNERTITTENGIDVIFSSKMKRGISLGDKVIVPLYLYPNKLKTKVVRHELGHCRQSLYLGWLYLIVIELPSICWAGLHRIKAIANKWSYYAPYTEKWADKLAGIKRR